MEALLNIADWYTSPGGTFIIMVGGEKCPHMLPRPSTDKLVMKGVACYISTGLLVGLIG